MKNDVSQLHLYELKKAFLASGRVPKSALRGFYGRFDPALTEQAFRRILYALEKRQALTPIGAGLYALHEAIASPSKKNYVPLWSLTHQALKQALQVTFPYLETLSWETGILSEWMTHQPGGNQIILETEKDACESVFNALQQKYPGQVFLEPDRAMMERYVLPLPESILISRLITQSPKKRLHGVTFPRLEKILVDLFVDSDQFFAFQGAELVHIFENSFAAYWISEKTLFRYAGRRKAASKLNDFIQLHTDIKLNPPQENQE